MVVHFLCLVQTFQENVEGLTDLMDLNLPSFGVWIKKLELIFMRDKAV
jgi:hypothetical protein